MPDKITHAFSDCIEALMQSAEQLPSLMIESAELISNVLINEGKILTCGTGISASDAQNFASQLIHRQAIERPALPAIALSSNISMITNMSQAGCFNSLFSNQIKALGNARDLLLLIHSHDTISSLIPAIQAAHMREMMVILLHGEGNDSIQLSQLLHPDDLNVKVPSTHTNRIQEIHRFILNNICDLIDHNLFGLQR
ncbi:MAG: SIS domain-containing protein [Endozoicomonadaceae bacterium]|nr:SIS domain-containing protein [Endozoicomonadaceae bacterium]